MALTVTDLENKIKEQAGALAIAGLQIQSLLADNQQLRAQLATKPEPETKGRKRSPAT